MMEKNLRLLVFILGKKTATLKEEAEATLAIELPTKADGYLASTAMAMAYSFKKAQ